MNGDKNNGASGSQSVQTPAISAADVIEALDNNSVLDQTPIAQQDKAVVANPESPIHFSRYRIIALTVLMVGLLGGGILVYRSSAITAQQTALNNAEPVKPQTIELQELSKDLSAQTPQTADKLNINGQLNANDSLVLAATAKPTNAIAGQIYYDGTRHQVGYYDGKGFVYLQGSSPNILTNNYYSTNTTNSYYSTAGPVNNVTDVTNVTNVTNVSGGSTDSTAGTVGSIAMFTAANTLGNAVITQAGTNLNVGSAVGASSTLLQGGTGGVDINTANAAGASGGITIQSGDSSTTGSGNVTIDAGSGVVNGTVTYNATFESGLDGFGGTPYSSIVTQSNVMARTGTHSLQVPLTLGSWASASAGGLPVTPGHTYHWSAWIRAATASSTVVYSEYFNNDPSPATITTSDTTGSWTQVADTFTVPIHTTLVNLNFVYQKNANNEMHYIDDVTLTDLAGYSGLAVNVGTTNAAGVNIGNTNQVGATTITGHGVALAGGNGNVTVNGNYISGTATNQINLQSGTDTNILTANTNGASGAITLQSGDSATTASGNVTVDTGSAIITGTQIYSKDFESGTQNLAGCFGFGDTIAQSNAQAHSGNFSLSDTTSNVTNGSTFCINDLEPFPAMAVVPGHNYAFSIWVRTGSASAIINTYADWSSTGFGGGGLISEVGWASAADNSAGWTHLTGVLVAPAGAITVALRINSFSANPVGTTHFFDDYVVTDLSSSSAVAALQLGATNAQLVTLGNTGEIGPTSIYGGGININAGVGNLNITGGALTETSAGASYSTTSGALDITAARSSTWKIGGSGFGGGTLTIKGGDAGGSGNTGGNLILQSGAGSAGGVNGSIAIDAPGQDTVSGTIVDQKGFETGTQNMLAATNTTVAQTNTAVHSGGFSLSATSNAAGLWEVSQDSGQAGVPVIVGDEYYFSGWVRAAGLTNESIRTIITWAGSSSTNTMNTVTESGGTWMHISGVATAPAGATSAYWNFVGSDAGGKVNLFDDLWVTDISSGTGMSALNLGASYIQSVNIGNQSQVGATSIQGGAGITIDANESPLALSGGSASLVTADDIGATGNIDIHSGDSSTTASGNVTLDTGAGIVSGTVVDDRDFEGGVDAMSAWFGDTVAQSNAQAHGGSESLAVTATGSFVGIIQNGNISTIPIVAGHHYFFSAWMRAATSPRNWAGSIAFGCGGGGLLSLSTGTDTTTGWTQITGSGTAPAGSTCATWRISTSGQAVGEVHYFDDLVTTDLSSSSAISDLELGATNAQVVTLGNMNEIGLTSINGGSGITMDSGQANYTVNGGAINVTGSGASLYQTTAGALNITAADASTWQVGTATTGNGGDLNIHAGQGSFGTSNGGNLILQAGAAGATGTGSSGAIQIGAGGGAALGYAGVGNFTGGGSGINGMTAQKLTTNSAAIVTSMSAYLTSAQTSPNNNFQFAIYDNNAGAPGNYIASSAIGTMTTDGWYSLPITANLSASTTYWLVYWQNDFLNGSNNAFNFISHSGAMEYYNQVAWQSGPNNGFPTAFPTSGPNATTHPNILGSLYASFSAAGPAITVASSGLMTQSGPSLFQDPTDSATAFQIQNSLNDTLFTANTADMAINVEGSAQFKNQTDTATAFDIQNSAGTPLLTAATDSMTITIAGTDASFGTLVIDNAHFESSQTTPPTIGIGTCTGSPAITAASTDSAGSLATGSLTGGGNCVITVTFHQPYGTAPKSVVLTPMDASAADSTATGPQPYVSSTGTSSFAITFNGSVGTGANYKYYYWVIQ